MRQAFLIFMAAAAECFAVDTVPVLSWTVDCQAPAAFSPAAIVSGEAVVFQPQYKLNGRVLTLTNAVAVALQFRLSGETNAPYSLDGTIYNATNGQVRITWPSSNVVAAGAYDYKVLITGDNTANLRAFGQLTVDAGFGSATGAPPPYVTLVTSGMVAAAVAAHDADSNTVHGGFILTAYQTGTNAWNNATNALAQISAHLVESWQTVHSGYVLTAYQNATNALAIAQTAFGWGNHALAGYVTGTVVRAEVDPVWGAVSNAVTQGAAAGLLAGTTASNIVNQIAATGTYHYATSAGQLSISNGAITLTVSDGLLTITEVTNTTSVRVTATAGEGYNGPAVGTVFTGPILIEGVWTYISDPTFSLEIDPTGESTDITAPSEFWITWYGSPPFAFYNNDSTLPTTLVEGPSGGGTGTVSLAWGTSTNVTVIDLSGYVPANRTITVNGATGTLDSNVTFTVTGSTDAPAWIAATNTELAITITNDLERPQYLYATGAVSLAFAGLRPPQPFYLVVRGPDSLAFPSGTHFVGGASWQTNQANHFIVWQYTSNLYVNPVTTSTEE